ncbi:zinc-binding dehydrogenase [Pseudomonas putida]|uniref:zinc-binding dehydrogenase n=1 Tax=Pseudomonas putida TaxID=303 RepID=UPI001F521932|nr:zinc-binding dehydrogenase [Pseudomonas putida]MCI1035895.1 zinc-binding dehydrogenase [Pseudomonas putida]
MKSIIYDSFGSPESVLKVANVDLPEPSAGQIRVKLLLSCIHNHDLWTIRGSYGYKPSLPAGAGSEGVGIIDALGEGVVGLEIGQRVATATAHGVWAEFFVANASDVVVLPPQVSDESGAQLIGMPISALLLLDQLNLEKNDWLVQSAANGAVGRIVERLADLKGIKTLNLVRRDNAISELKSSGVKHALSTESSDWLDQATEILGDNGAQAAIDSVGGALSGKLVQLLGEDGTLVSFGAMSNEPMIISPGDLIFKHATVTGFWAGRILSILPSTRTKQLIQELIDLVTKGDLILNTEEIYSLDNISNAAKTAAMSGRTGKVLLRP